MKTKKLFLGLLFTSVFAASVTAQGFEGKITMKLDYDLPEEMQSQAAMLPTESIAYYKSNSSRIETESMFGQQTFIVNEKKESILLIDMMGQKIAMKLDIPEEQESEKPTIEYVKGSKEIAGYTCKKAIVKYKNEEVEVYYTEEIKAHSDKISGLKGFPMEYQVTSKGMTIKTTVTEVLIESVPDDKFTISEEYTLMTFEEFQNMMGGSTE